MSTAVQTTATNGVTDRNNKKRQVVYYDENGNAIQLKRKYQKRVRVSASTAQQLVNMSGLAAGLKDSMSAVTHNTASQQQNVVRTTSRNMSKSAFSSDFPSHPYYHQNYPSRSATSSPSPRTFICGGYSNSSLYISVPMIVKTDIRRQYCKMLMNVLNTFDFPLLWSFFETFANPRDIMMIKQPLYPPQVAATLAPLKVGLSKEIADKLQPSRFRNAAPYTQGLGPHQPPVNYEPILPNTNVGLCFCGIPFITYYWASLLQMIPDQIITFDDIQIITRAGKTDSYLLCRFSVIGQELYDLNFKELVEDLMEEMMTKPEMLTNPPIALSRAVPSASRTAAATSARLAVSSVDDNTSVLSSVVGSVSSSIATSTPVSDSIASMPPDVAISMSSTESVASERSSSILATGSTLSSKELAALLQQDASLSLPVPDPTLIPPDLSRPLAPSAYYDPIQVRSRKRGTPVTMRPTPLTVQGLCYIHVDEDKRIRCIDFRLFGDGSLIMKGAGVPGSDPIGPNPIGMATSNGLML